ncbi:MAG: hypothetical protein JWQ98_816 [Chlorobi bacterium]|nr:hypothetical protein [Chlorobiota bacterium]
MRYILQITTLLLSGALLASCKDTPAAPPAVVIPGDNEPIIYSKHIDPIFKNGCGGSSCHLNGDNSEGVALNTWAQAVAGTDNYGAEIIPFSAGKSHLFQHINTDTTVAPIADPHMPLGRDPLPAEQIKLIRRWINEGAKNDAGEVYLADPGRPRIFVTAQSEDKVTTIDLATEHIMRYIGVGSSSAIKPASPHNIVLSPDHAFFYVNLINGGKVEKYDAKTFAKLGDVTVGRSPAQIAVTHDGSTLYVSNFDLTLAQRFIVRVNAATMTVTDTIFDVGNAPHGVTLSADEKHLYTTNALGDDISVINLATKEVEQRIPVSPGNPLPPGTKDRYEPYQGELSPDGVFLWVSCRASAEVRLLEMVSGRVIDSIKVGARPLIPKLTPDGLHLWVPNQGDNTISIIDVGSHAVVAGITGLKVQPHAIVFSGDGKRAYVSCENQNGDQHHPTVGSSTVPGIVYVIDVGQRKIVRTIEVGSFAAGMAIGG